MKTVFFGLKRLRLFLAASAVLHVLILLGISAADTTIAVKTAKNVLRARLPIAEAADRQTSEERSENREPERAQRVRPAVPGNDIPRIAPDGRRLAVAEARQLSAQTKAAAVSSGKAEMPGAEAATLSGGVTDDDVRQYILQLVPEARRLKRYPPLARENGWEGTVEITVSFGMAQAVPGVAMTHSSGSRVLDEEALAMVSLAVHSVPVPTVLRGKELNIPLPIRFSLED